jgi:hypothetical protein
MLLVYLFSIRAAILTGIDPRFIYLKELFVK